MSTVLITGGHSGLGLAVSEQLAFSSSMNLILAGRNPALMENAAKDLRSKYGVKVSTLPLDLSSLASVRAPAGACKAMLKSGEIDSLQAIAAMPADSSPVLFRTVWTDTKRPLRPIISAIFC